MANKNIFGLPEKKKKALEATASGMASEYGEELIGQKIAAGEIARDAAKSVARTGIMPQPGKTKEKPTLRDAFGVATGPGTPNTDSAPKQESAPEKKSFGDGFKESVKQTFHDPFGIGELRKNLKKKKREE